MLFSLTRKKENKRLPLQELVELTAHAYRSSLLTAVLSPSVHRVKVIYLFTS